jgi:hypothetical protein
MSNVQIKVRPVDTRRHLLRIPVEYAYLFPNDNPTCSITVIIDGVPEKVTYFSSLRGGPGIRSFGVTTLFKKHPELKTGSILKLHISDSTPQYTLTIARV